MEQVTRLVANLSCGQIGKVLEGRASPLANIKRKTTQKCGLSFYGAGDEARTRYLHLGKVALYRMSYTREEHDLL